MAARDISDLSATSQKIRLSAVCQEQPGARQAQRKSGPTLHQVDPLDIRVPAA